MRRKKIKFSPKLQSSSLDDIKRFVPKNALNTPVISNYNTLPTSYKNGGETDPPTPIVYDWEDLDKFNTHKEAFTDSTESKNFSDFLKNWEDNHPLGYEAVGAKNIFPSSRYTTNKDISKLGKNFTDMYAPAKTAEEKKRKERIDRVDPTKAVAVDWGYKNFPVWDAPKTEPFIRAKSKMEFEERPGRDIKMPGGIWSKERYIERYGQASWDAEEKSRLRVKNKFQNGGTHKYQNGGETDPNFRDTDFFTDEEKRDIILDGQRPSFNPGPIDFNAKPSKSFTKEDWDRMHKDKRSRVEQILGTETYNKLKDRPEFKGENVAEIFDGLGSSSWNDALQSHDQWHKSGRTYPTFDEAVEMFGTLPIIGRAKKGFSLAKGAKGNIIKAGKKIRTVADNVQKTLNIGDAGEDIITEDLPSIESIQPTKPGVFSGVPLYQNGGLPKYQMAGDPDALNKTDFFSEEEKAAIRKDKVGEGGKANPIISDGQNVGALQRSLNNIYPDLNLSDDGEWGPKTARAYQRFKADQYKKGNSIGSSLSSVTSIAGDIIRKQLNERTGLEYRPSPRTENHLSSEQLDVMGNQTRQALSEGRKFIDYPDYETGNVNDAYYGRESTADVAKRMLTDPAYQMKTTVGRSDIVITPEFEGLPSDTLVVDGYDFNSGSYGMEDSGNIGVRAAWDKASGGSAYKTIRDLGQYLGSKPGDPSSRQSIINIGS